MYKLLLCWRYLRTRYIALASIVSVTLGVATMIVVNSVMAGFVTEMQERIHGILSDLEVRGHSLEGFRDPDAVMARIREIAGDEIASMTPVVQVPAMMSFQFRGQWVTRQVMLVGIDERTQGDTSDFGRCLLHPENRRQFSFDLRDGGFDAVDSQVEDSKLTRPDLATAGWTYRRAKAETERQYREWEEAQEAAPGEDEASDRPPDLPAEALDEGLAAEEDEPFLCPHCGEPIAADELHAGHDEGEADDEQDTRPFDLFAAARPRENVFDPATDQHTGIVLGIALSSFRRDADREEFLVLPGDDVRLTFPTAGTPPRAVDTVCTIVDFYETKMSEYDSNLVFVPIEKLQRDRGMFDPQTGVGFATSIQIRLKDDRHGDAVRDKLLHAGHFVDVGGRQEWQPDFPPELFGVTTWRDQQGVLLAAVTMETAILNVLLFMIIAVAGFGILAIFFTIVVEKTRDIGILKSLGASGGGVMGIFLTYGLSLGAVGAGAGMVLGLVFVAYINQIADWLGKLTGRPVFDPSIYYFYKIPTIVDPFTILWIVAGALAIAVLASILPARRAARLHPVEALRYA